MILPPGFDWRAAWPVGTVLRDRNRGEVWDVVSHSAEGPHAVVRPGPRDWRCRPTRFEDLEVIALAAGGRGA